MPTDWLLGWSDITITTTTPHHDLMIIVMTFSFIIIMNFTIIIIRMTALTLSLSLSLFPTLVLLLWLSERAMEEKRKRRRTIVSWFSCSVCTMGKSGHIIARPVRQIELICNLICCYCCCCWLALHVKVSVFIHDLADNERRLEVNWFEFIW